MITGVGGFLRRASRARLRDRGNIEVAGFDRATAAPAQLCLDRYYHGDIVDAAAVESAVRAFAPDWLFHLAGVSGTVPAATMYMVNVIGAVNLLEAVRRSVPGCGVLLAGSFAEYGPVSASALPVTEETPCRPAGAYGVTKYAATLTGMDYAKRYGLKVVVARPSNIIGPGVPESLVVGAMLARAKKAFSSLKPVMKVGDFESERDFVDASDVAEAYVRLAQSNLSGEVFNICSGRSCSIRRVAEVLISNSSRSIALEFDPDLVPPRSSARSTEAMKRPPGHLDSTLRRHSIFR